MDTNGFWGSCPKGRDVMHVSVRSAISEMKIHLIDNTEIEVIGASEPKSFEGIHLKTSYAAEIIYKFYQLVTGTEFNGEQANWLILENERVRIWKCKLRAPIDKMNLYSYECVTDSEHPIR